jgi:DeoR/GlpR family transcriptional regulator of sugar metabolism
MKTKTRRNDSPNDSGQSIPGLSDEQKKNQQENVRRPAWNDHHVKRQIIPKTVLARFVATHQVVFGQVIQMASGTTLTAVMEMLTERQIQSQQPLELIIMTTNLEIANIARDANLKNPAIFATQQVLLTGGELHPSLLSLVGPFAAKGVMTDSIKPNIVILGAAGVSFNGGFGALNYHYGNELETQIAYATRPTLHRIILFDHEKLNVESGFRSTSLDKVLETTEECSLITYFPDDADEKVKSKVALEMEKFKELLQRLSEAGLLNDKTLRFKLIDSQGSVYKEIDNHS